MKSQPNLLPTLPQLSTPGSGPAAPVAPTPTAELLIGGYQIGAQPDPDLFGHPDIRY